MKFRFEFMSNNIYLRYAVIAVSDEGRRTTCGVLDLTQPELDALQFILKEGVKSYQDGEVQIEFAAQDSKHAYTEGV